MSKKTDLNDTKLREEIVNLKKNLLNLNFQKSSGQLEKTSELKKTKKDIARIKANISSSIGEKNA